MDNSLNLSQIEPTMSKNIFKKPVTKTKANFEISLNESTTTESQGNKSEMDLDSTSAPKKAIPFKKTKKPEQQFSVTLEESLLESDCEKTVANQKFLMRSKNQPGIDFFNVSYSESKLISSQMDSIAESNTSTTEESMKEKNNKSNPFRKSRRTQKENLVPESEQMEVSISGEENLTDIANNSNNQTNITMENSDINTSNLNSRKNIFKRKNKPAVNNIENVMQVSSIEDDSDKTPVTKTEILKPSLFKKRNTKDQMMEVSSTYEISLERSQNPNESFTPQESERNSFRKSSRLSLKESSIGATVSDYDEIENDRNLTDNPEIKANVSKKSSRLSMKDFSMSKTSTSKARSSRDPNNLSVTQERDLNYSRSSRTSGKKNLINDSQAGDEELKKSKNNSNIFQKSKGGSFAESFRKSRAESIFGGSITDNDEGLSKSSLKDFTEKNRNLSTTETTKKNLSVDNNLTKTTNKSLLSEVTLDQSSFNDDNLNNWMSDQSDHSDVEAPEINIPPIPPVLTDEPQTETVQQLNNSQKQSNEMSWEAKFNEIISKCKKSNVCQVEKKLSLEEPGKTTTKPKPKLLTTENKYRPPRLRKPSSLATKNLYQFILKKIKSKYGIDYIIEAEQLVLLISDTVKKVLRKKDYQKKLVQDLKKEMAKAGVIETTLDFYEFVIKFLPYNFRVKVVPCFQPITNTVYPPKDTVNPFDKIL